MATYTTNLNLKKPAGTEDINIADINGNMDTIDAECGLVDISSYFTVNSTYCDSFKAFKYGKVVFVSMYAKAGTTDQTNLVTNIQTQYRPKTNCALSTFWMNWTDAQKFTCAYVMTSAIQLRTVGTIEGSSGVIVSGCYMI